MSLGLPFAISFYNRPLGGAATLNAPSDLALTILSSTSIKVDFTINAINADGHKIERSSDLGVTYSVVGTVLGATATFTDTVTADGIFYYRVRAYDSADYSSYCDATYAITSLLWLDGTMSGNTFVDKSGNGRNFTITGNDFVVSVGFPYKSAATISAPAGDAALIAADVNGFLARQIQFFMRLFALRFGRVWRKPVNHTDIMVNGVVCGAQHPVSKTRPFNEYYSDGKPRTLFIYRITPGIDLIDCQIMLGQTFSCIPYDYKNFIDFIVKLFTGKWKGWKGKKAKDRAYCIELSHMIMREFMCDPLMDQSDYDNDPEMSRQWAEDNLFFVGEYKI